MIDPPPDDGSRARVDRLRTTNPAAADLATLLSTAVRVEPALVRRVRLLIPTADVGAELDLWTSDVLGSASPLALSFDPSCASHLRSDLAGPAFDGLRERAAAVISASHAGLHWSLRLEEQINRLAVDGGSASDLLYAAVGELLARAGASGADAGADPAPVARWLLAALSRIPRSAAATEAGAVASLSAGTCLDKRFVPSARSATVDVWMPWLLATAGISPRSVPVSFLPGRLMVNRPGPSAVTVTVPETDPMTLDLSWYDDIRLRHQRITFRSSEVVEVPVPGDQVSLETLTGDRYRLVLPRHGARSGMPVAGFNFSLLRGSLRPCLGRADSLERVLARLDPPGSRVALVGPAGSGKSVLLGAVLDHFDREGFAVIQHFFRHRRSWDTPDAVGASLRAKLDSWRPTPLPGVRRALLVEVHTREHQPVDVDALAAVLGDPAIGNFEVTRLVDPTVEALTRGMADFLNQGGDGLSLVYLACPALRVGGTAYLAAVDTDPNSPATTGLPESYLAGMVDGYPDGDLVFILDCPFTTARPPFSWSVIAPDGHDGPGARAVFAAPTEVAPTRTRFTATIVTGLRTGDADLDRAGAVTLENLFDFVVQNTRMAPPTLSGPGSVVLANRPRPAQPVLLALDGAPDWAVELASEIATEQRDARLIVTNREPREGATVDTAQPADLDRVGRAMLDHRRTEWELAFDTPPPDDDLLAASGSVPGRLAAILDWLLDQPVGTAELADLPPTLTVDGAAVWDGLVDSQLLVLSLVAATRTALTVADLSAMVPTVDLEALAAARLVRLDGPAGAPATVVTLSHPGVAAEVAARQPADPHGLHVAAFPYDDVSSASLAQLSDAAYHHVRYGDSLAAGRLVACVPFLDLRRRTAGLDALIDDLAELASRFTRGPVEAAHRTVVALRPHLRAEPEWFVDIVHNGLIAAEVIGRQGAYGALEVAAVHRVEADTTTVPSDSPVLAAVRWRDGETAAVRDGSVLTVASSGQGSWTGPDLELSAPTIAVTSGSGLAIAQRGNVWVVGAPGDPVTVLSVVEAGAADVTALAETSGGLVIGRADGTVTRYGDTRDPQSKRMLLGHRGAVTAIADCAAGLLTAGAGGTIRIWAPDGTLRRSYQRHLAPVVALAPIGADGVLSGDDKGRLRWWSADTGIDLGVLAGHSGRITAIVPTVDGGAVTAGTDGAVLRWRLDGTPEPDGRPLSTDGTPVLALATSGDGHVAAWSADGVLVVRDRDGAERWTGRPDGVAGPVHALDFDDDGSTLVVTHAGGVTFCPTDNPPGVDGRLGALAIDSKTGSVVFGTRTGMATFIVAGGPLVEDPAAAPIVSVAVRPRGSLFAVDATGVAVTPGGQLPGRLRRVVAEYQGDDVVRVWLNDLDGWLDEGRDEPGGHLRLRVGSDATALAAATDGRARWIAAGHPDGTVVLTRLDGTRPASTVTVGAGEITALAFDRSVRWLATGGADGRVHRCPLDGDAPPTLVGRHRGPVTGLVTRAGDTMRGPGGRIVSASADGSVRLWDATTGDLLGVAAGPSGFRAVAASAAGVFARDDDGRLWELDPDVLPGIIPGPPRVTLEGSGSTVSDEGLAGVTASLRFRTTVDLLAVRLDRDRPLWTVEHLRLIVDDRPLTATADGVLPVPRRLRPGPVRLYVLQRLRPAPRPDDLVLTFVLGTPGSNAEHTVTIRLPDTRS